MALQEVEYVVIGSGPTGSVVAARLAEAGASVALLEAGYHVQNDERVDIPGNFGKTLGDEALDWRFETVPQPGLGGRKVPLPRGKALGGTTVINSMTWGRASKEEYNDIAENLGNRGWKWDELLPHFKASETLVPPASKEWALEHGATYDPQFHGESGPLQRGFVPWLGASHVPFFKAMNSLGVPTNADSCNGRNLGVFTLATAINPRTSKRCSAANAFYEPNANRIHLIDGALVQRIELQPSGSELVATAVHYEKDGRPQVIKASKEVILSAGSYQTPKILELSGIGNPRHLQRIGVKPLVELPGVGENLQDHLLVPSSFELKPGIVTGDALLDPKFAANELEVYKKTGGGQYSSIHSAFSLLPVKQVSPSLQIDSFLRQVPDVASSYSEPALQKGQRVLRGLEENWFKDQMQGFFEFMHVPQFCAIAASDAKPNTPYLSILSLVMRPFSRGYVHAQSQDAKVPPIIDPRYLSNPADVKLLVEAMKFARRLCQTGPLAEMIIKQVEPPIDVVEASDERLVHYIQKNLETAHHPSGTASMMPRELGGVVGADLRVYGVANLRVADLSILPIQLSSHPQATLYAIGGKAASLILNDHSTPKIKARL